MQFTLDDYKRLLKSIDEVPEFPAHSGNTEQIFDQLLDVFLDLTDADCGFIGMVNQQGSGLHALQLQAISARSGNTAVIESLAQRCAQGLQSRIPDMLVEADMLSGEPLVLKDPGDMINSEEWPAGSAPLSSFMALPIQHSGELVGLVGVAGLERSFSEGQAEFLQPLLKIYGRLISDLADGREQNLKVVLESSPAAIIISDAQTGLIRFSNRRWLEIMGLEGGGGEPDSKQHFWADLAERNRFLEQISQDGQVIGETRLRKLDGELLPVMFTGQHNPGNADEVLWWVVDISEQKKAQEKLQIQELLLEQILHHLPVGVFCKDINNDFRYTVYNQKCEELFRVAVDIPLGKTDFEFLPRDKAQEFRAEDLEIIRTNTIMHIPEHRIDCASGETLYLRIIKTCVRDSNGKPNLIVGAAEDITRQRQIERELRLSTDEAQSANEAKTEFLSRMSHELRTPLNAVLGFGQLLQMNNQNLTDTQAECVDQILAGGNHLLELIEDVLDLSRIETGHMSVSLERVSTTLVLQRCVSMVEALADSSGVQIFLPALETPDLIADSRRLQQVLVNLMTNAIKYNRVEGNVEVKVTRQPGSKVRISVVDTGLGIHPDDQDRLFEPFERIGAPNVMVEGTGIGLSICRKLTRLMGGEIGFESDFGVGSTFWIDLPEAESFEVCESSGNESDISRLATRLKGIRILYVEDHLASIRLMSEIAQKIPNCEFTVATNAPDGVALASSARLDLILMDINLPGLTGFDALEMLKNDERTRKIPVIALSATATAATMERGRQAGFAHFLSKPLDLEQLFQAITSVCR